LILLIFKVRNWTFELEVTMTGCWHWHFWGPSVGIEL